MLSMRITGGRYCNRKVLIPEGDLEIRPAMDRMRESLFAILGPLDDTSFCDLFSGSACVGIEAASRGANLVHMVEMDAKKKDVMEKNISYAKEHSQMRIYIQDVLEFLKLIKESYDIVYADPPFPMPDKIRIAKLADQYERVKVGGLFVVHIPKNEENLWPQTIGKLQLTDTRLYGRNMIKFYKNQESR